VRVNDAVEKLFDTKLCCLITVVVRHGVGWRWPLWSIRPVLQSTAVWYRSDQSCKIAHILIFMFCLLHICYLQIMKNMWYWSMWHIWAYLCKSDVILCCLCSSRVFVWCKQIDITLLLL